MCLLWHFCPSQRRCTTEQHTQSRAGQLPNKNLVQDHYLRGNSETKDLKITLPTKQVLPRQGLTLINVYKVIGESLKWKRLFKIPKALLLSSARITCFFLRKPLLLNTYYMAMYSHIWSDLILVITLCGRFEFSSFFFFWQSSLCRWEDQIQQNEVTFYKVAEPNSEARTFLVSRSLPSIMPHCLFQTLSAPKTKVHSRLFFFFFFCTSSFLLKYILQYSEMHISKIYKAMHLDKSIYLWTHTPINIRGISNTPERSLVPLH